jgi:uncharacterized SAM-binding protein YcdF (DUF218 family)
MRSAAPGQIRRRESAGRRDCPYRIGPNGLLSPVGLIATLTGLRLLRFVFKLATFVVSLVLIYLVITAIQVWQTGRRYEPHQAGAIVVMGAAQYNGVPSPDLAARLDEAEILWHQHYATTIMVTGSKQPGDHYTEAEASARYLMQSGIPGTDIFEAGGNDSWENLADAAPTLKDHGDTTVLMVTDPFHEARSLAIASSLGLQVSPTPTKTSPITGAATIPYYAKETVGVALGRIIGYDHLSRLHTPFS